MKIPLDKNGKSWYVLYSADVGLKDHLLATVPGAFYAPVFFYLLTLKLPQDAPNRGI